jgi:hypothetical protein
MKIELDKALAEADKFWVKFGKYTKFKTKDEYKTWLKSHVEWYNKLPKKQQLKYINQTQSQMKFTLDNINKQINKNDQKTDNK